ncbi:hypothetical protein [Blastococcus deserti]|uniref:DivIVA domain-containing protein n=1 Tax=Blastococcus deserti TaxID=2259033 RepID=A0ABW4X970_9ACTN
MLRSLPAVPTGGTAAPNDPRGRIRALVLPFLALGLLAWLADGTAGLVLVLAMTVLVAAALMRPTARPGPDAPVVATPTDRSSDVDTLAPEDVSERLRRLHDAHVEQVNMAVAEERYDLVQELSDSYMDEALSLITAGERPLSIR